MARNQTERDEFDEQRPRKKKKRKKQEEAGMSKGLIIALAGGGAVLVLGLAVLIIVWAARSGAKPMVVSSYYNYSSAESEFGIEYPEGWIVKDGGIKDHRTASFDKGSASIHVSQSIFGSVVGDIAGSQTNPNVPVPDDLQPVARVHELKKKAFLEEMGNNCKEGKAETVQTRGFGNARRSVFTTSAAFKKTRGYRATVLATLVSYDIVCECSESDWPTLEPAFARIIQSIGHGTGQ
jgi:hypothetical protein